jgi:hypothetical protein
MTRRRFLPAAATVAAGAAQMNAQNEAPRVLELRVVRLRNSADQQRQRLVDFLKDATLPALQRAKLRCGFFQSAIAADAPWVLAVVEYASLAAMESARAALTADAAYVKQLAAFNARPGLSYTRIDTSVLRCFSKMPALEPGEPLNAPRVFELRTYESNNTASLRKKIGMFEDGEIAVFRKCGIQPVFFGETIIGPRQPNLTYLVSYESLAAREAAWKKFVVDPDWVKMRDTPGFSDAEIVSNISSAILGPLPFSPVR